MWIISKSRLREFWGVYSDAKTPLEAWYKHVENADWTMTSDVKADYGSVDFVGDCAVFNIGGNKYRLIARVIYHIHKVFVLRVMTHHEYDTTNWEKDCGCHSPPPKKTKKAKKTSSKKRKRR